MWHDIEQNNEAWMLMRSGKVTGSAVAKVMANFGKAFGDPARKLAVDLAVQQITGKASESTFTNAHMERGHEQEPMARALYEEENFCEVGNGGFYDNGFTGCSPDGIVATGLIEIKSVIASTQYATLKKGSFDSSYKWQIVFNLRESEKEWLDYVSFCAEFPVGSQLFTKRLYADEFKEEFKQLDARVAEFQDLVAEVKHDIESL